MPEKKLPVDNPAFWSERLENVRKQSKSLHKAVFECPPERWQRICIKHAKLLEHYVLPHDFILEVGCGWGRLINLLPQTWKGGYIGYDLCPDFIRLANDLQFGHKGRFVCGNILDSPLLVDGFAKVKSPKFDLCVMVSVRPMVKRNLGEEYWSRMESLVKAVSRRQLYLEYDEDCNGFLEFTKE